MNMPRTRSTANISSSMTWPGTSRLVAQSMMPELAPEKARIWLKVAEPSTIMKTMTVTASVPSSDFLIPSQVRHR